MKTLKVVGVKNVFAKAVAALLLALPSIALGEFNTTTPLPQALLAHTAVISNGRIYVAGGVSDTGGLRGDGGFLNNVYYCAEINPDGTLGEWQVAASLPEFYGLGMHNSVVYNDAVYVIGGRNMWGPHDTVYYAPISSNGALGDWQGTTPLPKKLMAQAAAVHNGIIYVLGGISRTEGITDQTYWAQVQSDHTLGAWNTGAALPKKLFGHKAMVVGDTLFVIGGTETGSLYESGNPNPNVSQSVYSAAINADGSLGDWIEQPPLPVGLSFHSAAASGANMYVAGGFDGSGVTNAVYFAPVGDDGTLGEWESLGVLPQSLLTAASVAYENFVYVLGGGTAYIDEPQDSVYYMPLLTILKASVKILPWVLNKHSWGKWITALIEVPEAKAKDIDTNSVHISAVNGVPISPIYASKKHVNFHGHFFGRMRKLIVKFDRKAVQDVVPEGEITLRIEGSLKDGRKFAGENTNWIIQVVKKNFRFHRHGRRFLPDGAQVDLPEGSFPGNPELLLTIWKQKLLDHLEKILRKIARNKKNLLDISEPVEFGPHGMKFLKPITIFLPYDPENLPDQVSEDQLIICYWNSETGEWEKLESFVDKIKHLVHAKITHFSVYQVMADLEPEAAPASQSFALGDVYVFPNPARAGAKPTLHIETGIADSVEIKIYTISGRLAHEIKLYGAPNHKDAYEHEWSGHIPSGVYFYTIVSRKGTKKLKAQGKFGVVR